MQMNATGWRAAPGAAAPAYVLHWVPGYLCSDGPAEMTGCPVTVEKSYTRITCVRALRFRRKEPLFYVIPLAVAP
jgi:hypothetical protein